MITAHEEEQIADAVADYYADLAGYLRFAYPWGEPGGPLEHFDGPEEWAMRLADDISEQIANNKFDGFTPVPVIYVAVASGNGAAKSAFAGMVNNWIMSTRPYCRGTVSANTGAQLRTKTWPEMEKWTRMSITSDWFEVTSEHIYKRGTDPSTGMDFKRSWFSSAHTWNIGNSQASAGQHARNSTSYYLIDESSHVPEVILEQMDGGLTDGEPMFFLFGNCTNRASRLFRAVFGNLRGDYINRSVDTRTCKYTNKEKIEKWRIERGEDSDWFKAHVKGEAPSADDLQFIDNPRVQEARRRTIAATDGTEPLVLGIDFARGGSADNRLVWRRGRDARTIPSRRIPGEKTRDTTLMVTLLGNEILEKKPDAVFGDAGGMGGPILDRLRQLYGRQFPIVDVMFGGASPKDRHGNMRAYMWDEMRLWLHGGCIEDDEALEIDLTGPQSYESASGKLFLESKDDMEERGLASPDWGDAMATTFAAPAVRRDGGQKRQPPKVPIRRHTATPGRNWMRK